MESKKEKALRKGQETLTEICYFDLNLCIIILTTMTLVKNVTLYQYVLNCVTTLPYLRPEHVQAWILYTPRISGLYILCIIYMMHIVQG